jgi:dynein heavy chain 1
VIPIETVIPISRYPTEYFAMEAVASSQASIPGANGAGTAPFAAMDPARVVDHLAVLLEAALGATRTELEAPGSLLSKTRYSDTLQRCSRFASETQVALYIQKELLPSDTLENGDSDGRTCLHEPVYMPA